jgi:Protein of unknown function (DUF1091)
MNPDLVSNLTFVCFNDSLGVSRINYSAVFKQEFNSMFYNFALKIKDTDAKDYDREVFKGSFNFCKPTKGVLGKYVTKLFLEPFRIYSNFKFECPVTKTEYFVKNLPTPQENIFPRQFLGQNMIVQWEYTHIGKGKPSNKKKMVDIYTLKLYGETIGSY